MELWDIYDIDRIKTGKTVMRGDKMYPGQYHNVVHVVIFNSKGEMLIQQRKEDKDSWPNMWDVSVGGSVISGENTRQGAEREVMEELGLKICLDGRRPALTANYFPGYDDVYLLIADFDTSILKLQPEEVKDVMWASEETILSMIDEGTFIPNHKCYISYLFALKDQIGIKDAVKL